MAIPKQQPTCLIIEDSDFDQQMMRRVVENSFSGLRIMTASTLKVAREHLTSGQLSLILLDNNLPDGRGINFAQDMFNDVDLPNIPIIMVSDWPSPFMWEKAEKAGVLSVVNKAEFKPGLIRAALRRTRQKKSPAKVAGLR